MVTAAANAAFDDAIDPGRACSLAVDKAAVGVVRGRGALDLAIGQILATLCEGPRLLQLGFARQVDYARERLGISPRYLYESLRLARGLADKPLLLRAVALGVVSRRKALTILPVAVGDDEPVWTAAAMRSSDRWLRKAVKGHGVDALPEGLFEMESICLRTSPEHQDKLDAAIALARESGLGHAAPRWKCVEAISQEWLGSFGGPPEVGPDPPPTDARSEESWRTELKQRAAAVARQLAAVAEALDSIECDPPRDGAAARDVRALDARVRRLLAAKAKYDRAFGPLAERIVYDAVGLKLGYRSTEEYCRERLGLSAKAVRQRAWLERRMCALPALREALDSGRLTYSKALLVAKSASVFDVERRIAEAEGTTWQQTERAATEREDRRNRAAGVRREWGPGDALAVIRDAIASARAVVLANGGPDLDDGEALAVIADHYIKVWEQHQPPRRRGESKRRRRVLMRQGGLCAVPGCSREAVHVHHIEFRSRGGCSEEWNELGLCAAHHLFGVHRGYLRVTGRAGERLVWRFPTGEVWVTEGDDDVRCAPSG